VPGREASVVNGVERHTRVRAALDSDVVAIVVSAALALSVGSFVVREPALVDKVSVTNPSEYDIGVQVSSGDRDRWMAITTAARRSTTTTVAVIDQLEVWVFRFRAQGRDGGDLRITRHDLDQAGWAVTVPDDVIRHLRDAGAPPPP
jgi:hypothetical protein